MKRIEVAVGILENVEGLFLVGQRTVQDAYYKKWEFPGGKLENGETATQALGRELAEELNINVIASEPFMTLEHDYPDRHVALYVHKVTSYEGVPESAEGQALRWVAAKQLSGLDFLAGNQSIIDAVVQDSEQAKG